MNNKFSNLISLVAILMVACLSSCGFGHASQRTMEGSYTRYSGEYPIQEHWAITIYEDGSCSAVNTASGFKNYTHEYSGSWTPVSDDVIEINIQSKPYIAHVTKSNDEVDHQASKAQTKWKRDQVYSEASNLTTRSQTYSQTFYIRKDGATSPFRDGLDNPIMICK